MVKDSPSGYGIITIALHWICASLIIFLFGLGIYVSDLDYYSPWYHRGAALHVSLGVLLLVLMTFRVVWRLSNKSPVPLLSISKSNQFAATLVKMTLYAITFIICVSGYLITTAKGQGASFFDIMSLPAILEVSSINVDRAGLIHIMVAWSIVGVAVLHASAALFHHFVIRDRTLLRMLKPPTKN